MKRSWKIGLAFLLSAAIWIFVVDLSPLNKIVLPVVVLGILGVLCLWEILSKVRQLEDHPEQRAKLEQDIQRCHEYYQKKGYKFKVGKSSGK